MGPRLQRLKESVETQQQALEELQGALEHTMTQRSSLPKPVQRAVRNLSSEVRIARMMKKPVEQLGRLSGKRGLKVNLGCGSDVRPGFVNIDLDRRGNDIGDVDLHPDTYLINFDLRLGLPLEVGSCDFIYSSHFFEHLPYQDGVRLMRDSYRALRFGGVFRIALPNLKLDFDAYLRGDDEILGAYDPLELGDPHLASVVEAGMMTRVDWINYGVYQSGEHMYIYDEEKVSTLLRRSGFHTVASSSYQEGIDIDEPLRRDYSFYVEAVKARKPRALTVPRQAENS
jgi:SAM-dependent methyltransferase